MAWLFMTVTVALILFIRPPEPYPCLNPVALAVPLPGVPILLNPPWPDSPHCPAGIPSSARPSLTTTHLSALTHALAVPRLFCLECITPSSYIYVFAGL